MENSTENKVKFKDCRTYEDSPFEVYGIEDKVRTRITARGTFYRKGEPWNASQSKSMTEPTDTYSYTKFFHEGIHSIKNLGIPAYHMLHYASMMLKPNKESVVISAEAFLKEFDYSATSLRIYYSAVTELITRSLLAKKANATNTYWINPNILFNGNRLSINR